MKEFCFGAWRALPIFAPLASFLVLDYFAQPNAAEVSFGVMVALGLVYGVLLLRGFGASFSLIRRRAASAPAVLGRE